MNTQKKLYTSLLCLGLLTSCLFTTSCINNTSISPRVAVYGMWINSTAITSNKAPVVEVGDTIKLSLGLHGCNHQLKYVRIHIDRDYFTDSLLSKKDVATYCTESSVPGEGYYAFKQGITGLYTLWHIIPKKARDNQEIPFEVQMVIENDTKVDHQFNPNSLTFYMMVSDSTAKK